LETSRDASTSRASGAGGRSGEPKASFLRQQELAIEDAARAGCPCGDPLRNDAGSGAGRHMNGSRVVNRSHHVLIALVLAIAVGASFWRLGMGSLHDWDEAIYAQVAKEMNATGDWLQPHYEYKPWVDKPPLLMWSTALLFHLFGVHEFWARAASALAGAVVIVLTFLIAAALFDRRTGLMSAVILATTFEFLKYARRGMTDAPLTMFVLLAVYGYIRVMEGEPRWWYGVCGACALAVMVKSLAALIAPAAMLLVLLSGTPGARGVLRSTHLFLGLAGALLIAAPWHALMAAHYGPTFWSHYFGFHVAHALSVVQGNSGDQRFYLRVLAGGMFPWVYLLPFAVSLAVQENLMGRYRSLILLAVILVVFGLYQFSRTKLPYYIMPALPPLAILTGRLIASATRSPDASSLSGVLIAAVTAGALARNPLVGLLLLCALAALFVLSVRKTLDARVVSASAFLVLLALGLRSVSPLYREGASPVASLAAAASRNAADREPLIVFSGLYRPAALFYSGRPIFEARTWGDIGSFADRTPRRIIMAKGDLASKPAGYAISVEAEAGDLIYGWVSHARAR